jgi:hypothetical protein
LAFASQYSAGAFFKLCAVLKGCASFVVCKPQSWVLAETVLWSNVGHDQKSVALCADITLIRQGNV